MRNHGQRIKSQQVAFAYLDTMCVWRRKIILQIPTVYHIVNMTLQLRLALSIAWGILFFMQRATKLSNTPHVDVPHNRYQPPFSFSYPLLSDGRASSAMNFPFHELPTIKGHCIWKTFSCNRVANQSQISISLHLRECSS